MSEHTQETTPENTAATNDTLTRTLALRLLAYVAPQETDREPQLLVGALPKALPLDLPLPLAARVVGSYLGWKTTIALDCPGTPEEARAFYREQMKERGFREVGFPGHGGFMPAFNAIHERLTLCQGESGPSIEVMARSLADGKTDVRLEITADGQGTPCHAARERRRRMPYGGSAMQLLPTLPAPAGSLQVGGGGGGGGEDSAHSSADLEASLPLEAIQRAYEERLVATGWARVDGGIGGLVGWSVWTFRDEEEQLWHGLFTAIHRPDRPDRYHLSVWINRDSGQTPGSAPRSGVLYSSASGGGAFSYSQLTSSTMQTSASTMYGPSQPPSQPSTTPPMAPDEPQKERG